MRLSERGEQQIQAFFGVYPPEKKRQRRPAEGGVGGTEAAAQVGQIAGRQRNRERDHGGPVGHSEGGSLLALLLAGEMHGGGGAEGVALEQLKRDSFGQAALPHAIGAQCAQWAQDIRHATGCRCRCRCQWREGEEAVGVNQIVAGDIAAQPDGQWPRRGVEAGLAREVAVGNAPIEHGAIKWHGQAARAVVVDRDDIDRQPGLG